MNATHLVASELMLVLLLAGCAGLPTDQACRAGLEKELEVFSTNGHTRQYHRSPDFVVLLAEAEVNEQNGDYQSCLDNLSMARRYGYGPGHAFVSYERQHIDSRNGSSQSGGAGGPRN